MACSRCYAPATMAPSVAAQPPKATQHAIWLALPALGSWLLLAVTNHLAQDVASVPFLWVLPLLVYLFSFVLTTENDRWYRREIFLPAAALLLAHYELGLGLILLTVLAVAL